MGNFKRDTGSMYDILLFRRLNFFEEMIENFQCSEATVFLATLRKHMLYCNQGETYE